MRTISFDDLPERIMGRQDLVGEQGIQHVLNRELTASEALALDLVRLPVGLEHKLHRHPSADQVMVVLEGELVAFDDTREVTVGKDSTIVFGAGEWHGVRVTRDEVRALNMFCGVGMGADAGYEESEPANRGGTDVD
jgi:mannose-6-phosphate isomerase-like protein (cupin superfamily)